MKKYPVLAALILFSIPCFSQLGFFEAEGNLYYDVAGAVPNSDVEFYSEKWGGKLLRRATTNADGKILLQTEKEFRPAFVLNRSIANTRQVKGNGFVHFTGEREFLFDRFRVSKTDNMISINWEANVNPNQRISFRILKSADGINFEHFKTLQARESVSSDLYNITDQPGKESIFYKVEVINETTGKRYTSSIQNIESMDIRLFPSAAKDYITIALSKNRVNSSYRLINQSGQVVESGMLPQTQNTVQVGHLAAGNYFVVVAAADGPVTLRFSKL